MRRGKTESDGYLHKIVKMREHLMDKITRGSVLNLRCPECGMPLSVRPGQERGVCFACGSLLDLAQNRKDALAHAYDPVLFTYADLLSLCREQLSRHAYDEAVRTTQAACAIDASNQEAWYSLLRALTEDFRNLDISAPDAVYEQAQSLQTDEDARRLHEQWDAYTEAGRIRAETRRQQERERAEQRQRVRDEMEKERQKKTEAEAAAKSYTPPENQSSSRAPRWLTALLTVIGIAAVVFMIYTGIGFVFIIGASFLGLLGNNRRRH